jgi:hypothetical protein
MSLILLYLFINIFIFVVIAKEIKGFPNNINYHLSRYSHVVHVTSRDQISCHVAITDLKYF